ncbi:MAG: M23 family metallopeptidase [Lachnospiraceae bacterium]|nr:M23 family metallopeptidase [Lachnospiraceae bacterium]
MEKYTRKNLKNIRTIVQNKTGVVFTANKTSMQKTAGCKISRMAFLTACLLCFITLSAFAWVKLSDLNGDKIGFACAYQGKGRFDIVITNSSDRVLKLQDKVKVMQWSTGDEVEGDPEKIWITHTPIAPHSQGIVSIDLSEGYDYRAMENALQEGDWYYFVLTNNNFAFGQDWMCSFDFKLEKTEEVQNRLVQAMEEKSEEEQSQEPQYRTGDLIDSDWIWPTVSRNISAVYGRQENGAYSDHINIAGVAGDNIYSVADGTVREVAFDAAYGNVIVVDLGEGVSVKYGHLKDIKVSESDEIHQGQVIAALGQTGMATGPNLSFSVIVDGEAVDPLTIK